MDIGAREARKGNGYDSDNNSSLNFQTSMNPQKGSSQLKSFPSRSFSFTGKQTPVGIELNWSTTSEQNNRVLKSCDLIPGNH
jgi:hypothetical protein